jgi:uncharacterized phage protein gp47/JayE
MPFKRPTLKELIKQARAAFDARLPDADARLKQSILNVNAAVMAGLVNGTYGYLDYLAQNLNQQTQDEFYLVRTGQLYGLAPNPAVLSSGNANFTGIDTTPVPSGTELADSGGNLYETSADAVLGVGNTLIAVAAKFGGADGNLEPGAPLYLTSAITGVAASAAVDDDGFSGGMDAEDIGTAFRARVIARIQTPPGGAGTLADYERWTKAALAEVTRVTVTGAGRGAGTVDVRFVCDNRVDPIPLAGDLAAVLAELQANAPLTDVAGIGVPAPVAANVDYALPLSRFATADQQAAAVAALGDLHKTLAIGEGLSVQAKVIPALTSVSARPTTSVIITPVVDIAPDVTKVLLLGNVTFV